MTLDIECGTASCGEPQADFEMRQQRDAGVE